MFKSTTRIAAAAPLTRALPRARSARRFISTAPPHQKSRSWKSSAARWGLAGALVYYYNTASAFAEEPNCMDGNDFIHARMRTDYK
jgi:mitochondrial intermembrane space import and assembly protein 40